MQKHSHNLLGPKDEGVKGRDLRRTEKDPSWTRAKSFIAGRIKFASIL